MIAVVDRVWSAGMHCRRRRETPDGALIAARALLDQGRSWRAVAEATGVQKDTLRRRLTEADLVAQKSPGGDGG